MDLSVLNPFMEKDHHSAMEWGGLQMIIALENILQKQSSSVSISSSVVPPISLDAATEGGDISALENLVRESVTTSCVLASRLY